MTGRPEPPASAQGSTDDIDVSVTGRTLFDVEDDAHCAFLFDYDAYREESAGLLDEAVRTDDPTNLMKWLLDNQRRLKNPFNGEFLEDGWVEALEHYNVAEFGAYALSAYFEPSALRGLGGAYDIARDALIAAGQLPDVAREFLLGQPMLAAAGSGGNGNGNSGVSGYRVPDGRRAGVLPPQRIPAAVRAVRAARDATSKRQPEILALLDDLLTLLEEADSVGVGVMFLSPAQGLDEEAEASSSTVHAGASEE